MSTASPVAKYKDPAEIKRAGKEVASAVGGKTVAAFFDQNKATLEAVLPKHVSPERMLKIALGALRTTPKLMQCTVESLFGAVVQCSQLGLEPNTPMGHVYLIPFEKKTNKSGRWEVERTDVQIVIGYKGMLDLARRSGQIVSISAHEVCARDEFQYAYGLDERLQHVPAMGDRGEVTAFYAVAKLRDGGHCFEVMSRAQVEEIRDNSQGYKAAVASAKRYNKDVDTPWHNHFIEMGRKTVTRRLFKWLPMSIEMATAAALDGKAEAGAEQGLSAVLDGEFSIEDPDGFYGDEGEYDGEIVDTGTGEVITQPHGDAGAGQQQGQTGAHAWTFGDLQTALKTSTTRDELDEAAALISSLPNATHRDMLNKLYDERVAAIQQDEKL